MSEQRDQTENVPGAGDNPAAERGRTVLVLGGGGMKGIAHAGVVKALEEGAIRPDAIVGTSIGALVGTLVAGGLGWRELTEIARRMRKKDVVSVNRSAMWFGGVRSSSVFEAGHLKSWMKRILPAHHFQELIIPLRFNATSLVSGREVWFGSGCRQDVPLVDAIYSSCALPVYYPPQEIGDDHLVDGGVVNMLPLSQASKWGADRIIAVDVGSDFLPPDPGYFDYGLIAVHDRVLNLSLLQQRKATLEKYADLPMVYIRPKIGHLSSFDFSRTEFLMEEGYRAASEALSKAEAA